MENFLCCLTFSSGKTPAFRTKIIQLSTWMRWPSPSVCQSLDSEEETFWCNSCLTYKVYFPNIKDIWFASPKYVQINLSLTSSLARPPQLLSFFEVRRISRIFNQHRLLGEKRNDTWIYEDKKMQRTSKIAQNSGFMPAEASGLHNDVILLCLASSTTPRRLYFDFTRRQHDDLISWLRLRSTL